MLILVTEAATAHTKKYINLKISGSRTDTPRFKAMDMALKRKYGKNYAVFSHIINCIYLLSFSFRYFLILSALLFLLSITVS